MSDDLDDWLRAAVARLLRGRGYRGGPRRFCRETPDSWVVVEFQGSVSNYSDYTQFVVNLGVLNKAVAATDGLVPKRCPSTTDCHISMRLGELGPDRAERWWVLRPLDEADDEQEIVMALEMEALPFLDATSTITGFRDFWRRQGGELASYYLDLLEADRSVT